MTNEMVGDLVAMWRGYEVRQYTAATGRLLSRSGASEEPCIPRGPSLRRCVETPLPLLRSFQERKNQNSSFLIGDLSGMMVR